jgi:hypothetical protein
MIIMPCCCPGHRRSSRARQTSGTPQARREATADEVYLLVRSLAHATAAMPVPPETLHRAADIVLAGLASHADG